MRRPHPDHRMDIPISLAVYHQLLSASADTCFQKEDWEIAAEAIDEWVRRHNPDLISLPATRGYQWKSLFLPDGTLLRTVFGAKNHHCVVENDRILYDGVAVSPSGFVNAVGGIRRNAWRSIWILLPEEKEWKLADTFRTRQRSPRQQTARPVQRSLPVQAGAPRSPATPAPAGARPPHQGKGAEAGVSDEPRAQQSSADKVGATSSTGGALNRGQCISPTPTPLPCPRGADRRVPAGRHRVPLLRARLLPLLKRLCGFSGEGARR